jgi:FkbM family methyltransferase
MLKKLKSLIPNNIKTRIKKLRRFNGYHDLDKKLLKYINYKNGFYIDCGANDGVNQSTTWYFEKYLNWTGLLIEPIPEVYNQLIKNRDKKNYFYNYALVNSNYDKDEIDFVYDTNDSLLAKQCSLKSDINFLKKNEKKISVRASSLETILINNQIPKMIDLFSLDVEGDEFNVLQGINFKNVKFKYILIETDFPKKVNSYLESKGYLFIERLSNYNSIEKPDYGDYLYKLDNNY